MRLRHLDRLGGTAVFIAVFALMLLTTRGQEVVSSQGVASALRPFVEGHKLAGAVILVADRDRILSLESIGFADVAARRPMATDALFWIASQSKPITAAALMMLVDEGRSNSTTPWPSTSPNSRTCGSPSRGTGTISF